jgi:hypothetical protein
MLTVVLSLLFVLVAVVAEPWLLAALPLVLRTEFAALEP